MSIGPYSNQTALREFEQARLRAALKDVLALVTRTSDELLSYEEVARRLQLSARSEGGIRTIPVEAIVGSVGRAADFTRDFLPRRGTDSERWAQVRNAFIDPSRAELPPIEVYQVGEVYFVLDGNHRVSVAKREGITYIEAHVIEIQSPVPLTPDITPEDLICKAEFAEFLMETGLGTFNADFDFSASLCGLYPKLREQIAVHQLVMSRTQARELDYREAAADWLETTYAPLVRAMRERGLQRWFPDRTETDLYLWVTEHQQQLRAELGWEVRPEAAVTDWVVRARSRASMDEREGSWQRERLSDRYVGHLFMDVLVPLNGTPDAWDGLEQALWLAKKEEARVHGLFVTPGRKQADKVAQKLEAEFMARCAKANVAGDFVVETGGVARKICERALLTDLIVLNVTHPPTEGLSALRSGWRSILKNAARPILAVPQGARTLERALVLFDGSEKAKQALFVAAYFGEMWRTALTVLMVKDRTSAANAESFARAYLELHELDAEFIGAPATSGVILDTLTARATDVLLLGSDNASQWQQVRGKSLVTTLLREAGCPVLVCP